MRDTFARVLLDIAREDPNVLLLTGDLGFGVLTPFAAELPQQFINVGVAEQNLTGIATGLALSGYTVFTYSIANFPTLRCLEQIRNDACYHDANVKIVAVGAGFSYGALGISHHATEDLAVMRSIPNLTVLSPADREEAEAATRGAYLTPGTCYLRIDKSVATGEGAPRPVTVPGPVRFHRRGDSAVIFATGGILDEALQAAAILAPQGIHCAVISVHTIKPLDTAGILDACRHVPVVISLEEHTIHGGLGGAIAEAFADSGRYPPVFRRIALRDGFSSLVGTQAFLRRQYGLDAEAVAHAVCQAYAGAAPLARP